MIFHFVYGLVEFSILSKSTDAEYECGRGTWGCIVFNCVIHWILMFVMILIWLSPNDAIHKIKPAYTAHSIAPIVGYIWAAVCLYNTKPRCVTIYENEYQDLWDTIKLEVYTGIVFTTMFIVYCLINICNVIRDRHTHNANIHALLNGGQYIAV
jgi:hypothetical protein